MDTTQSFRDLRNELGLTQEECAALLDLSLSAIAQMENRENKVPPGEDFSRGNRRNYRRLQKEFFNDRGN